MELLLTQPQSSGLLHRSDADAMIDNEHTFAIHVKEIAWQRTLRPSLPVRPPGST